LPTTPESTPTPPAQLEAPATAHAPAGAGAAVPPAAASGHTMSSFFQSPLRVTVLVLAILLAAQAWSSRSNMQKLRLEVADRLAKGEMINAQTTANVAAIQNLARSMQEKVTLLESRQSEAENQQVALEQMYQDMSKNRDEWALAEIEQVLATASQQLQLAGNVQGALIALQNADRSLSGSETPQFINIRRAIAKDIDKLKALPSLDLVGVALRIDNVIAQVDTLPMLADEKPSLPAPKVRPRKMDKPAKVAVAQVGPPVPETHFDRVRATWRAWSDEMWTDIRQLIRVRQVTTPEALMVSPEQAYFVRENLKLRLLNARLALMSRNETAFRTDLAAAQDVLARYFDVRAQGTQTAQGLLRQVQANDVSIEMPSLVESLNAVRNYKTKP
jgi:uroporphyrin-3 C-methyltransferase